jgi:hypothetical protein
MEVTKWLKPSDSVSRNTVTARFYAVWAMPARQRGGRGFTKICSLGITVTDKLTIAVTFHPERGYVGTAPDLRPAGDRAEPGRAAPQDRSGDAA